jgi:hypothetical protein
LYRFYFKIPEECGTGIAFAIARIVDEKRLVTNPD